MKIANTGSTAVNGWKLVWTDANGQTVTQSWSADYAQSGSTVSLPNASYTASIPAGGSVGLGFIAGWSATNTSPSRFTLNGTGCA